MKKRERKERKRSISLGIVLFLMVGALSGCAKNAEQGEKNVVQDEKQETEAKETKGSEEVREITDMAGRTVKVPAEIDSVFSPKPTSAIYLYTLVPDAGSGHPRGQRRADQGGKARLPGDLHLQGRRGSVTEKGLLYGKKAVRRPFCA